MLESSIEKRLKKEVEKIGGRAPKFESPGNNGMPDRIVILPGGRIYFIETKRPTAGKPEKLQRLQHRRLRELGCQVRVTYTYDQIDEFIREVRE